MYIMHKGSIVKRRLRVEFSLEVRIGYTTVPVFVEAIHEHLKIITAYIAVHLKHKLAQIRKCDCLISVRITLTECVSHVK
jgi:hypothetical protein